MWTRWLFRVVVAVAVVFGVMQLVPYGRPHSNPPVTEEPNWPGTRVLAARACFDCHSNETKWPWYSHVAPVSWLVFRDTMKGRAELNFSEWDRPQEGAKDAAKELRAGEMPPSLYRPLHPAAGLSNVERAALVTALDLIAQSAHRAPEHSER